MYTLDLNISKDGIQPQHFINKEVQLEGGGFGEYSTAQFASRLILTSIGSSHPKGNIQSLRRTLKIKDLLEKGASNGGMVAMEDDDFKYLRSSFDKCSDWNNNADSAVIIDRVYRVFEEAKQG